MLTDQQKDEIIDLIAETEENLSTKLFEILKFQDVIDDYENVNPSCDVDEISNVLIDLDDYLRVKVNVTKLNTLNKRVQKINNDPVKMTKFITASTKSITAP